MIKITNGFSTLEVTKGAFKDIFSAQGFSPVCEMHVEGSTEPIHANQPVEDKLLNEEPKEASEGNSERNTGVPESDKLSDDENLSEIPISEMTNEQLKKYAEQLGVDLSGATTRKAVMSKIRSAL